MGVGGILCGPQLWFADWFAQALVGDTGACGGDRPHNIKPACGG